MDARGLLAQGLIDRNPGFVQLLGLCPLLAVSTSVASALGLGLATIAVLMASGLVGYGSAVLFLFAGGAPPRAPFPGCGSDPTGDSLECEGPPSYCQPVDTDQDGLTDDVESALGTDPQSADTDGDGLGDGAANQVRSRGKLLRRPVCVAVERE